MHDFYLLALVVISSNNKKDRLLYRNLFFPFLEIDFFFYSFFRCKHHSLLSLLEISPTNVARFFYLASEKITRGKRNGNRDRK